MNIVEKTRPPTITLPRPLYSSDPAPGETTSGSIPKTLVSVLIKIGLILDFTDSIIALSGANSSLLIKLRDWCTIRIALLITIPMSITNPSIVNISRGW